MILNTFDLITILYHFSLLRMADSSDSEGSEHQGYPAAALEYHESSDYEISESGEDATTEEPTFDPTLTAQHAVSCKP